MLSSPESDPLRRYAFLAVLGVGLCSVGATLWSWVLGLVIALLGAFSGTLILARAVAPLRAQLASLPVRRLRKSALDFDEMGYLVESSQARLGEIVTALRKERDDFQSILRGITDGVLVIDDDERIERINEAAHRLLGTPHDALGRKLSELSRNLELLQLYERARRGEPLPPQPISIHGQAGPRLLRISAARILGEGDRERVLLALHDLTDVRRLEQVRTDFVTNVTHEMRSPLASILGYAETLAADKEHLPADAVDGLERIARNARRLDNIVGDLIKLSRLEHATSPNLAELDLHACLDELAQEFSDIASERRITLKVDSRGLPNHALLDRALLEQALGNLLENAIKYSFEGGEVNLFGSLQGAWLELCVIDHGPGIPREHQPRIFERFYRVDAARSRAVGGTGLGLSIVKHAAAVHGGSVRVVSELGRGSTFILSLPHAS